MISRTAALIATSLFLFPANAAFASSNASLPLEPSFFQGQVSGMKPGLRVRAERAFAKIDSDGNGIITGSELIKDVRSNFDRRDANGNGYIDGSEQGKPHYWNTLRIDRRAQFRAFARDGEMTLDEYLGFRVYMRGQNKYEMNPKLERNTAGLTGGTSYAKYIENMIRKHDKNGDLLLNQKEFIEARSDMFGAYDTNNDGKLGPDESGGFGGSSNAAKGGFNNIGKDQFIDAGSFSHYASGDNQLMGTEFLQLAFDFRKKNFVG